MKNTGIVRRLDHLGRITLPIELRRTAGLGDRAKLEIHVSEEGIVLRKYDPDAKACSHCHSVHDLVEVDGEYVCRACLHRFINAMQQGSEL